LYHIHISIDLIIADARSVVIFLQTLADIYYKDITLPPLDISFRDYVFAEQVTFCVTNKCLIFQDFESSNVLYQRSKEYWLRRAADIPSPPQLHVQTRNTERGQFERRRFILPEDKWKSLKSRAVTELLTRSALLCAGTIYLLYCK
jgi:yersiniabactin nonribosomal peptide/polyketide synthase